MELGKHKLTKREFIGVFSGIFLSMGAWFVVTPVQEWFKATFKYGWMLPLVGIIIVIVVLYFLQNK